VIEFKPLVDLADKLGVIEVVKDKLIQQRDPAIEKFIIALDEITKLYSATESELSRYLSVWLETNSDNQEERALLLLLESGPLLLRWASARGHCHKLNNIYNAHLNKWFARLLQPDELDQIQDLFSEFGKQRARPCREMTYRSHRYKSSVCGPTLLAWVVAPIFRATCNTTTWIIRVNQIFQEKGGWYVKAT